MAHLKNGYWHHYINGVEKIIEIGVDWGHGPGTPGKETPYIEALGRKIQEEEFNIPAAKEFARQLNAAGFKTFFTAAESYDVPLTTRTNRANARGVTILVSWHFNAMGNTFGYSTAKGFSAHIQKGSSTSSNAYKLAKLFIEELAKGTPQTNRGIVLQDLAMTRQTKMPAVLLELGFMDDPTEALLMLNKNFHKEAAQEGTAAVCRYFGVTPPKTGLVVPVSKRSYFLNGDIDPKVKTLQKDLNALGYTPKLTEDGIFGDGTEKAVVWLQKKAKLDPDGVAGKDTLKAVAAAVAEKQSAAKPVTKPKEPISVPTPVKPAQKPTEKDVEILELEKWQREEMAQLFKFARDKKIFTDDRHEKEVLDGTMTVGTAIYLQTVIAAAALNDNKRVKIN